MAMVTGPDLVEARDILGVRWGLGRPLMAAELGRVLRLRGRDPGQSVRAWETGQTPLPGPVSVLVEMMLSGCVPPTRDQV
jgi:hypothetical protein